MSLDYSKSPSERSNLIMGNDTTHSGRELSLSKDLTRAPVYTANDAPMAPRPRCKPILCLLFLSQPFITTRALLKKKKKKPLRSSENKYENLVSEDIRTIYFWSWQHRLWTLLWDESFLWIHIFQNRSFSSHVQETMKYSMGYEKIKMFWKG